MTLTQLRTAVLEEINQKDNNFFKRTMLDRWLNDGNRLACATAEYLQKRLDMTLSDGTYALPSDFYKTAGVSLLDGTSARYPVEVGVESALDTDLGAGIPEYYLIWGNTLFLQPKPVGAVNGTLRYIAYPAYLVNDTDSPELPVAYHQLLVVYAAHRALLMDGKTDKAGAYLGDFKAQVAQLKMDISERRGVQVVREVE